MARSAWIDRVPAGEGLLDVATLLARGRAMRQAALRQADLAANLSLTAEFVSIAEQAALLGWAGTMADGLGPNGPHRTYRQFAATGPVDPLYDRVQRRVEAALDVGAVPLPEPKIGRYLSVISAGGAVHAHRDDSPPGTRHLRCNLFLQLSEGGGRPVVHDTPIDVAPRMLLSFYPNEMRHRSEAVTGARTRIILSFGYTVGSRHRLPPRNDQDPY